MHITHTHTHIHRILGSDSQRSDQMWHLSDTRATFETPKYPRRLREQYMAQIVNTLELSAPDQIEVKKIFNLVISLVKFQTTNTYVAATKRSHCETVALWNSLVTWKLAQYLSDVTESPTVNGVEVCQLWLFCWYRAFAMCFSPIFMVRSHSQCCRQSI